MAIEIKQTGYLYGTGPVFVFTGVETGKVVIVQGYEGDTFVMRVKGPDYANVLRSAGDFSYTSILVTMGNAVADQQIPIAVSSYKKAPANQGYQNTYTDIGNDNPLLGLLWQVIQTGATPIITIKPPVTTPVTNPVMTNPVMTNPVATTPVQTVPTTIYQAATSNNQTPILIGIGLLVLFLIVSNQD